MTPQKLLGLVVFCMVFLHGSLGGQREFAFVVLLNGIICHLFGGCTWDVACNAVMIAYVNATTTWQPYTLALTVVAVSTYLGKKRLCRSRCEFRESVEHVLLIQIPLVIALCFYVPKSPSFQLRPSLPMHAYYVPRVRPAA